MTSPFFSQSMPLFVCPLTFPSFTQPCDDDYNEKRIANGLPIAEAASKILIHPLITWD
jgi:hypothetical protein